MRSFEFLEPTTVPEASAMLAHYGDNCRILAGGTALMLALRQRMVAPSHVVSIARVSALRGIAYDEQHGLRVGALTLHSELARSPVVRKHYPMLADMALHVADPQVRNQGTLGGNLCYADPATDPPTTLVALNAQVVVANGNRERILAAEDFIVDYYCTALEPDELVVEVRVPPPAFTSGLHVRFLRTDAEHRPLLNLAITTTHDAKVCHQVRLVVGAATPTPRRIGRCESFLRGRTIDQKTVAEAADIIACDMEAISDVRGTEDFRRQIGRVVSRRTLEKVFRVQP